MQEQASAGFWLSPQQKFAWRLQQEGLRKSTRAAWLLSLKGRVQADRTHECLREIVSRHEILRTVFQRQTGMKVPFQVVLDNAEADWRQIDLSSLTPSQRKSQIQSLFDSEQNGDFSAEAGPMLKALLIRLAEEEFALILSVPLLCADARSLKILTRELGLFYSGQRDALPEPLRYVQFAQWQADLLESEEEDAKQGRSFWESQPPVIAATLPFEKRQSPSACQPECVAVALGSEISSAIVGRADASAVLLTALQCLIQRLSAQIVLSVGFLAKSPEYEELENVIGCLGRTLPLRARVENHFSFSDVVRQTTNDLRESVAVQEYFAPEAIALDGELFAFAYHDLGGKRTFGDVTFSLERVRVISERFKLRLCVVRRETELELEFHYDASRLERGPVERIAGYYQNLLTAAVANPATPVSRLPLLAEPERQQLLVEWNQTAAGYPESSCLHELFEQQAGRTPERMAVRCGEQTLTYRELNEQANQLAHYLRQQGVGPDRPVGLCLERSAETMVAGLAILKAGGAYVPLNPDNPPARLQQQLEGAAALLTETKLIGHMPAFAGPVLALDRDRRLWASQPKSNPACHTTPENLVYVIYTSGSTGVPKGVAVRHRNLVNYTSFVLRRLQADHPMHFATVSTITADLGNTCIFPALASGGCLHILSYDLAMEGTLLSQYLLRHPVDVLKIVPSHLQALLTSAEGAKILPVSYLILGGEALSWELLDRLSASDNQCEIINHYGPTETTVGSVTFSS